MRGDSCRWRSLRCLAGVVGFIAIWAFLIGLAGPAYAQTCRVSLQKLVNGVDTGNGPGPTLPVGSTVTWTYNVTNTSTGGCTLTNLKIIDIANLADSDPDVTIEVCTIPSLAQGDSDTCEMTGVVQSGPYENQGVAETTDQRVKAQDRGHYVGEEQEPACGDTIVGNTLGETCDPPGSETSNPGELCREDCTFCGDGNKDSGEECDDGPAGSDTCNSDCTLKKFCGDSVVQPELGETCDPPGSDTTGGVCRNDCTFCGDGVKDADEECDAGDQNGVEGSGCSTECTIVEEPGSCRYTGGGVDTDGNWDHTLEDGKMCRNGANCAREADIDRYQFGGQGGAPTSSQPQPSGEWTHHQQQGPSGAFTFHGGTASAPPGTEIDKIVCSDPGYCAQARPAPFKQLDMWGIGTFKNLGKGQSAPNWYDETNAQVTANVKAEGGGGNFKGTFHKFEVNVDDLGEPGKKNDGAPDTAECPNDGFGLRSSTPDANCNCPDYYRITIYDGESTPEAAAANNTVIYQVFGYIDGGNLQIHPAIR